MNQGFEVLVSEALLQWKLRPNFQFQQGWKDTDVETWLSDARNYHFELYLGLNAN